MKATDYGKRQGAAAPSVISSGSSSGSSAAVAVRAMRQIRLVRDDADERLREVIRTLREKYRAQIIATSGSRGLLFLRHALAPHRRPTTVLPEVVRLFARAGVASAELRLTLGAWLEDEIVAAAPAPAPRSATELADAVNKEGHEALRALHEHVAAPRCESRLRVVVREFREFIAAGGEFIEHSAKVVCPRREGA